MRLVVSIFALLLASIMSTQAFAGKIADFGAKAEALMDSNDPVAAVEALDQAMQEVWQRSPLVFRKALFIESAGGFGVYVERSNAVFGNGEPLLIYAEPIGFAYGKNALGAKEINLVADFTLTDMNDKKLFHKDDFLKMLLPVRYNNREFHMKMTVNLTNLPAGKYKARFLVRDQHSDKSGVIVLPFEKVE